MTFSFQHPHMLPAHMLGLIPPLPFTLQIAREVSMMTRFQHPHLVRAYHYVTWSSAAAADPGELLEVRHGQRFDRRFDQRV
jgi:hypothetical protein